MNTIKNIQSNNINVSIRNKILSLFMILLICSVSLMGIPSCHAKPTGQIEVLYLKNMEEEYQCPGEEIISTETNDQITSDPDFDEWYVQFMEKHEMRKAVHHEKEVKNHEKELEMGGTIIGTILLINGVIMVNSQMPYMLASSFGMITPGVLLVGAELVVIGSGMILISMYLFGENGGNTVEEVH